MNIIFQLWKFFVLVTLNFFQKMQFLKLMLSPTSPRKTFWQPKQGYRIQQKNFFFSKMSLKIELNVYYQEIILIW